MLLCFIYFDGAEIKDTTTEFSSFSGNEIIMFHSMTGAIGYCIMVDLASAVFVNLVECISQSFLMQYIFLAVSIFNMFLIFKKYSVWKSGPVWALNGLWFIVYLL